MATPTTREGLKDYCLRKLGFPVIDINVDDDQLEDRIDDALQKYRDYHYDGTEEIYLATQLTANNIANGYIDVSDNIVGITRIMPITGDSISSQNSQGFNIFDINYQIRLNDFYSLTASSYTYYYIARTHLSMLDMIVTGEIISLCRHIELSNRRLIQKSSMTLGLKNIQLHCSRNNGVQI